MGISIRFYKILFVKNLTCQKFAMIRQISRIFLGKSELKNAKRYLCKVPPPKTEYFEDSLIPKYSKEGIPMRDPRDINDPDYDKPVGNVQSENFTFDMKQGIGQTSEEEQEHFEEYVSKFGEARFSDLAKPNFQARNYTISSDLEEWKYVERLLPLSVIPEVPKKDHYPSGFKLPKYSAEEAIEKYQYFVGRTAMHMLPVYCEVKILEVDKKKGRDIEEETLITKLKKAEGNLFQLRKDLDDFLYAKYKREFICQVSELQNMLIWSGDFEDEIKEFLLNKGF